MGEKTMEINDDVKPSVILSLYEQAYSEIKRYRDMEWKITAWVVALIAGIITFIRLITFQPEHKYLIQIILIISIIVIMAYGIGHILFVHEKLAQNRRLRRKIEKILKFYEGGFYDTETILPTSWQNDMNISFWKGWPHLLSWFILIIAVGSFALYLIIFIGIETTNMDAEKMIWNGHTNSIILAGVILAVIGAILMSIENFIFIFKNSRQQAKLDYDRDHAVFAGNENQQNTEIERRRKNIRIRKIVMTIGFILLIIGVSLQITGAYRTI